MSAAQAPAWLRAVDGGAEITLYVQPGARKTEVAGEHDGALKLRINAPPVEGKANAAVIAFIAERCGVAKHRVALLSGELSRHKRLRVVGVTADLVLLQLLQ
ncbi:MAG: YggU family protein [Burkholderiales bacterium]|nr:YggU family protein [Burkholderiales bacterium]